MNECIKCGSTQNLTIDHIIPRWIYKRFPFRYIKWKKNLGKQNTQLLCNGCNNSKSGFIDCSTEIGRTFWLAVRDEINIELDKSFKSGHKL